jgi:valyl-tRNA synthetase
VLDHILRLLHPFVPFITEGIFQKLNETVPVRGLTGIAEVENSEALVIAEWPKAIESIIDSDAEKQVESVQTVICLIRDIRSKTNKPPSEMLVVSAKLQQETVEVLNRNANLIRYLAGVREFVAGITTVKPANAAVAIADATEVYVHDVREPQKERLKLEKQKREIEDAKRAVEAKLANENFVSRAKPQVVARAKERLAELSEQLAAIEKHLSELNG